MKKVAGYLRVSTDEQVEQGLSIPAQRSRVIAFCQSQGWELSEIYLDDGYSGKDLKRPDMIKMIKAAGKREFDVLVVFKLDRLSRRQKDVLYLLEDVFEDNNIGFKSVTESFDTTTPFGKAAIGMLAVFAQLERETIIERSRMGKKEAAKQGRFGGGGAPYGYDYNTTTKRLEINEQHAQVVKLIYDTYINKKSGFQKIADFLNLNNIPGPISEKWRRDGVSNVLRNPFYAGYVHHKGDKYPGQHEHIIDPELWETAQRQLESRYTPIPVKDDENLLSGLIWCAECGSRMRFKSQKWYSGSILKYYICYAQMKNKTSAKADSCDCGFKRVEKVNKYVIDKILAFATNKEDFSIYIKEYLKQFEKEPADDNHLFILKKEQESIQAKIDRWYSAFENGQFDAQEVLKRVATLREKRNSIEEQIASLEQQNLANDLLIPNVEEFFNKIQNLSIILSQKNIADIRAAIALIVSKVIISKDDTIEIEWRFDIPTC